MADNIKKLNFTYERLRENSNIMQVFSNRFLKYMSAPRVYLIPSGINVREVNILAVISEHPGIVTVEIAKLWDVTPGAVSQVLSKLESKGYIERRKEEGNAKEVHLYATEKGEALTEQHKAYNQERLEEIEKSVFSGYTLEEIDTFYKILNDLAEFYK